MRSRPNNKLQTLDHERTFRSHAVDELDANGMPEATRKIRMGNTVAAPRNSVPLSAQGVANGKCCTVTAVKRAPVDGVVADAAEHEQVTGGTLPPRTEQTQHPARSSAAADHGEVQDRASSAILVYDLLAIIEHDVGVDRGTRLVGAALMMPKIDEALPAGSLMLAAQV